MRKFKTHISTSSSFRCCSSSLTQMGNRGKLGQHARLLGEKDLERMFDPRQESQSQRPEIGGNSWGFRLVRENPQTGGRQESGSSSRW